MTSTTAIARSMRQNVLGRLLVAMAFLFVLGFQMVIPAMADQVDPLGGGNTQAPAQVQTTQAPVDNTVPAEAQTTNADRGNAGREFVKGYSPLKDYDPSSNKATVLFLNIIGKITSAMIWIMVAFFFFVTACDMMYINIPFMRPWLADSNEDGQGNAMGGMGMMGGGMGGQAQKSAIMNRQWVSDEAIDAVKTLGGSAQAQTMGGGGFGMMGGGGFGGGSTGMHPTQDGNSKKTVMGYYIKKRITVMILLGVAIVLLTGSSLMGFGMDIGTWLVKLIAYLGAKVNGSNVPDLFGGQ